MSNLPATISNLSQQITELTNKLAPVTDEQVSRGIRSLLGAGLALPSGMQTDKAPEIYSFALSGVPSYGVQVAIAKIIRGEYEINRSFVPSPPELAAIARAEARVIRDDKVRLMEKVRAFEVQKPEPVSEAGKSRIKSLLAGFRRQHAANKADGMAAGMPMTEEQADYYRKIMALNDASGVNAEQRAYRSAIERKVDVYAAQPDERSE